MKEEKFMGSPEAIQSTGRRIQLKMDEKPVVTHADTKADSSLTCGATRQTDGTSGVGQSMYTYAEAYKEQDASCMRADIASQVVPHMCRARPYSSCGHHGCSGLVVLTGHNLST
jgi:hypothetical protein